MRTKDKMEEKKSNLGAKMFDEVDTCKRLLGRVIANDDTFN